MKILFNVDFNFTSIRRRFYVSMQEKAYCVQKYNSGKMCALRLIQMLAYFFFWLSKLSDSWGVWLLQHVYYVIPHVLKQK